MSSHVHAFLSHSGRGILAAVAINDAGIRYEPGPAVMLPHSSSIASIGQAVVDTLSRYCHKDRNLRDYKKTEWPAFRASGLKSVRAFEQVFRYVAVERDASRLTLTRFEQDHAAIDTVHFPAECSVEDIGSGFMQLARRAGWQTSAEPGASPNGGPAKPSGSSGASEGPPSVS